MTRCCKELLGLVERSFSRIELLANFVRDPQPLLRCEVAGDVEPHVVFVRPAFKCHFPVGKFKHLPFWQCLTKVCTVFSPQLCTGRPITMFLYVSHAASIS